MPRPDKYLEMVAKVNVKYGLARGPRQEESKKSVDQERGQFSMSKRQSDSVRQPLHRDENPEEQKTPT